MASSPSPRGSLAVRQGPAPQSWGGLLQPWLHRLSRSWGLLKMPEMLPAMRVDRRRPIFAALSFDFSLVSVLVSVSAGAGVSAGTSAGAGASLRNNQCTSDHKGVQYSRFWLGSSSLRRGSLGRSLSSGSGLYDVVRTMMQISGRKAYLYLLLLLLG